MKIAAITIPMNHLAPIRPPKAVNTLKKTNLPWQPWPRCYYFSLPAIGVTDYDGRTICADHIGSLRHYMPEL
jgi:hypothetical protein